MSHYILCDDELEIIEDIILNIQASIANDVDLYEVTKTASLMLPLKLREYLTKLRFGNNTPYCVIAGFVIKDHLIGKTPTSNKLDDKNITREDIFIALISTQIGFPFSFATQQSGRLVQTIVPVEGSEYSQLGVGSKEELAWHTEDAFHPNRPDYLVLMCMRNHDAVATTVGKLPDSLTDAEIDLLFSENFIFLPDTDHATHLSNWRSASEKRAFERMQEFIQNPQPQSILYGSRENPFMRIDPKFTRIVSLDHESTVVYARLVKLITDNLIDIALEPGRMLIIDNHRLVHGRRAFMPKYDGTDRWLKKMNVTMDMKKSSESRFHAQEYIII